MLQTLDADASVRAVVLTGHGKSFCAGADLNWMKKMAGYGAEENLADAHALALMLRTLNGLSKPTIACVRGAAFGGGVGLVACCDVAVAAHDAIFSLSEAKLGLIPATIFAVRDRGDRRAAGATVLPHCGAVHRRGSIPHRPPPRHRARAGIGRPHQRAAGMAFWSPDRSHSSNARR